MKHPSHDQLKISEKYSSTQKYGFSFIKYLVPFRLVVWRCRQRGQNVQLTREARDENQFHFQSNIIYLRSSGSIRISGRSIRFGQGIHVFSKVSLYSLSVVEILVRTHLFGKGLP